MRKVAVISMLLTFIGINFCFSQIKADDVTGLWATYDDKTHEQRSQVQIFKENGKYFGKIVWLKEAIVNGKPATDSKNPDVAKQKLPLNGLQLISNFVFEDDEWVSGNIYDPNNGKTYSCKMWFSKNNKNVLHVKGFIGVSLIGREVTWTREYKQK